MSDKSPPIIEIPKSFSNYPRKFLEMLGEKAPDTLYYQGNLSLLSKKSIGFCGSRHASDIGIKTVVDCTEQAVEDDIVIISGNAAGVDFTAHYTALKNGGNTVLVLPEGLERFRIKKDLKKYWDWDRVLVISQFPLNAVWQAYRAMDRNKLIIALSEAMIVIEAGEKGGTMNAGLMTLKHEYPLFVALYDIEHEAKGNNILVEKGGIPLLKSKKTNRANFQKITKYLYSNQ